MYLARRARDRGEELPPQPREVPGTARNMLQRGGPGAESRLVPLFQFETPNPVAREPSTSSDTSAQRLLTLGPAAATRMSPKVSFNSLATPAELRPGERDAAAEAGGAVRPSPAHSSGPQPSMPSSKATGDGQWAAPPAGLA